MTKDASSSDLALHDACDKAGLGEAAREKLEGMMAANTYEWQSDFARKYVGIGREEGREEGRKEGRKEGREGIAESVIAILNTRGFTVSTQVHRKIHSCTDLETLKKWVPKAVTVDHPEDLFI